MLSIKPERMNTWGQRKIYSLPFNLTRSFYSAPDAELLIIIIFI